MTFNIPQPASLKWIAGDATATSRVLLATNISFGAFLQIQLLNASLGFRVVSRGYRYQDLHEKKMGFITSRTAVGIQILHLYSDSRVNLSDWYLQHESLPRGQYWWRTSLSGLLLISRLSEQWYKIADIPFHLVQVTYVGKNYHAIAILQGIHYFWPTYQHHKLVYGHQG